MRLIVLFTHKQAVETWVISKVLLEYFLFAGTIYGYRNKSLIASLDTKLFTGYSMYIYASKLLHPGLNYCYL